MDTDINIYIANLGKYSEGELVGEWVELPVDDNFQEVFCKIGLGYLDDSGDYHHGLEVNGVCYEEFAIHDYEAPFRIEEYESIYKLNDIAEKLDELEEEEKKVAIILMDDIGLTIDQAVDDVKDYNYRLWNEDSMSDIACAWHEECGSFDDNNPLSWYIDWERVGRDMEMDGTFIEIESGLWLEYFN
ncbi:antirestriction protein ArdA [Thermoactinomyces sp. DSM 45892]|uniref:antirestriction protein ArdA n=1 Tax=Thermoactinomyces sp. DSM 45892 TaxID=1882753 RepID=UPI00089460C3|nr:antirestriction protein ArdA [Thermoactinomyces sp. DSM 45892]SDX94584.1 Antirestriction protein (ArdA) [Thermoactinomyces sp. DSM 45892]